MAVQFLIGMLGFATGVASEHYKVPGIPRYTDFIPTPDDVQSQAYQIFRDHLIEREGYRRDVYLDTLGYETVGIGHKVLPKDNLKLGDVISDARVNKLFEQDAFFAFNAGLSQAKEIGRLNAQMIAALASVNFQLGTNWRAEWPNTWNKIKTGTPTSIAGAIRAIESSKWAQQTPVRAQDFVSVLKQQYFG